MKVCKCNIPADKVKKVTKGATIYYQSILRAIVATDRIPLSSQFFLFFLQLFLHCL